MRYTDSLGEAQSRNSVFEELCFYMMSGLEVTQICIEMKA